MVETDKNNRYILNTFELPNKNCYNNYISNTLKEIELELNNNLIKLMYENSPPYITKKLTSDGKSKYDPFIYTGTSGNIYVYWRYYIYKSYNYIDSDKSKSDTNKSSLKYFEKAVDTNINLVNNMFKSNDNNLSPSFYLGLPGIFALSSVYYYEIYLLKHKDISFLNKSLYYVKKIIDFKTNCFADNNQEELLYGYPGYLWTLLFVSYNVIFKIEDDNIVKEIKNVLFTNIIELFEFIIKEGLKNKDYYNLPCMAYIFPKNKYNINNLDKCNFYTGAAHGILGNMLVLIETLRFFKIFDKLSIVFNLTNYHIYEKIIIEDLLYLASIQFDTGNFPSSLGKEKDLLLHWCHGSTGAIIVYCKAFEIFSKIDIRYKCNFNICDFFLDSAVKAGNDLWNRGILLKGNGICHGISGNAYAFNSLYKATNNKDWYIKFLAFVSFTYKKSIISKCINYEDKSRKVKGIADSPFSLMEGLGGLVTLYSDILSNNVLFPGFELL